MPSAKRPSKLRPIFISFLTLVTLVLTFALVRGGASAAEPVSLLASPSAPDCNPDWVVVASPDAGSSQNVLAGISAVASNDVWGVGSYFDGSGNYRTLIEHWDGSTWSVVFSPNVGTASNSLQGVRAITSSNVWAVGSGDAQTLIEHWDGSAWSIVSSPNVGGTGSYLNALTAIASNDVWAVGYYNDNSYVAQTLTEHWDGSTWSVVSSPNVGTSGNVLQGVSDVAPNDIWAVGYYNNSSFIPQTLTEHWDGSSWSVVSSPNVGFSRNALEGVTAISSTDVWAVGYYDSSGFKTLTLHWNGSIWSVVSSPSIGTNYNNLFAVTAVTANDVWAVGSYSNGTAQTLTEHWDGSTWSVVSSPNAGIGYNELYGVTAISSTDVWAAGYYANGGPNQTLVEHYSTICPPTATPTATSTRTLTPTATVCIPGWSVVDNPTPVYEPSLVDVKAVTFDNIWAVGSYRNSNLGVDQTLIEHWDGGTWNIVSSPNVGTDYNYLYGITAVTANDVWAVGSHTPTGFYETLIEHWDGSAWSIVSSPNVGGTGSYLNAVTAIAPNDVWAVGYYNNNSYIPQTLTEHWDGSTWSVVASPNVGTADNKLYGVTAISSADVWAVGTGSYQTLTEHWNGSTWSVVASLSISPIANVLEGVTAMSSTDVWAVGFYYSTSTNINETLTEHWDGSAWSVIDSPDVGAEDNYLGGVTAVSSDNVWAVGYYGNAGYRGTLTIHWDGSTWSVVASPSPGGSTNILCRVTAISSTDVWAVGSYGGNVFQALTEHYSGSCGTPAPTATNTPTPPTGTGTSTPTPNGTQTFTPLTTNTRTDTPVPTNTSTALPTQTPGGPTATDTPTNGATNTAIATATACTLSFEDVPVGSTFYPYIQCMACRGIINGYPCGSVGEPCYPNNDPYFRPGNNVTRGQFAKITANAAGFNETPGAQQYEDVAPGSTFFDFIWRLSNRGYINGYPCGGAGEPCVPGNLPYFRPNASITRGQIAKIDANAAGYNDTPGAQQYEDVLPGSTFYDFIWRLSDRGLVNGYPCGGTGEPCGPSNLPYFRPSADATRGQASKIVSNTFFPACVTLAR